MNILQSGKMVTGFNSHLALSNWTHTIFSKVTVSIQQHYSLD